MRISSYFWRGVIDALPFFLIVSPFAMLFGVVARDAGLTIGQAVAMSAIVVAGASQLTAIALLQENAPMLTLILASLLVNLRMILYSAAIAPHFAAAHTPLRALMAYTLVDQTFAIATRGFDIYTKMTMRQKCLYYFGTVVMIVLPWGIFTFIGAYLGQSLPESIALDFAVPVCFIALLAPLLRSLPHIVSAFVSGVCVLLLGGLPWNLGLICAALLAMAAGAQMEFYLKKCKGE